MGTFANGRVEEFYECDSMSLDQMRDLGTTSESSGQWVARRMRELHEVPLEVMRTVLDQGDLKAPSTKGFGRGIENHIMASSHRPRRRTRAAPSQTPTGFDAPSPLQSYSYFAHPSPGLMTRHANASTMSFDSLATSYDSVASFGRTPSEAGSPIRECNADFTMSPLALGPSSAPPVRGPKAPYPGVWRRLKRWTREISKVMEMVNAFLATPEGAAITHALNLPAQLPVSVDAEPRPPPCTAQDLRSTTTNFKDMMLCLLAVDLPQLCLEVAQYKRYVRAWESQEGKSRRVFCHNDSQYGNLLMLRVDENGQLPLMASGMRRDAPAPNSPLLHTPGGRRRSRSRARSAQPHQRLVVIDFEYGSPNPRAYDIANHFHEWCADYHDEANPWSLLGHGSYPTRAERRRWLTAYVDQGRWLKGRMGTAKLGSPESLPTVSEMALPPAVTSGSVPATPGTPGSVRENAAAAEVERLEEEVYVWSPATHAVWGMWGAVMSCDDIVALLGRARACVKTVDGVLTYCPPSPAEQDAMDRKGAESFDNMRYSLGRIELFRKELRERLAHS